MKFLQAPWRWEFISGHIGKGGCVFCRAAESEQDRENLICHRGRSFYVILNRFPYATGHLMVVPYRHTSDLSDISGEQAGEMWDLLNRSRVLIQNHFRPDGFNVGMNLGAAAGAGIKEHIHLHLVPRWAGDANFMPVVGETRVMSYDLLEVYDVLAEGFRH